MSVTPLEEQASKSIPLWKFSLPQIGIFVVLSVFLYLLYQDGIKHALSSWDSPEYSHAYLIPPISIFILWQNYSRIQRSQFAGAWSGVLILCAGLFVLLAGDFSTLYVIVQYSLLIVLCGLVLSLTGISRFSIFLIPIFLLFFTIPLPNFLYNSLSAYLQLISSKLGVEVIRLFGISVFLEGNVIDLGNYKLQVVEACNGLRYLFPLVALGVITSYFYKDALWKKIVIVASTVPITVFMNSVRIGVIGVLVEYWGIDMAEGFLHDFEGWIIFMVCFAILLIEMALLTKLTSGKSLRDVLNIEIPQWRKIDVANTSNRKLPIPFVVACLLVVAFTIVSMVLPERAEDVPARQSLATFPSSIDDWRGETKSMELQYINALKFEDYLLSNYSNNRKGLELYIAYYDSQRKGESAHSPKSCLPGAGWQIVDRGEKSIHYTDKQGNTGTISVNRMLVKRGDASFLTYYWFKQRDRHLANEYFVKWYLFWDALTKNRTDGALVRVIYPLAIGEDVTESDRSVQSFLGQVLPLLPEYIPD